MKWMMADPITLEVKQQFPDVHPVLLQLLWNRNLRLPSDMGSFLSPDWTQGVHPPELFSQMSEGVSMVFEALEQSRVVVVHGDYDADGVCGSALLISTLRDLCRLGGYAASIKSYIPHREREGYGMFVATMEHLHLHEKADLVITVDCGISNRPAIDRGNELGIKTIVCDHHTIPEEVPKGAVLIHPLLPEESYPNKNLCGTGVAYKFACALVAYARTRGMAVTTGYEKWLLDLVAIASVTDMVKLIGENRVLEHFGLLVLNKSKRPGLRALFDVAGLQAGAIDTRTIGFQIGPRLNAAGRMAHANEALELLLSEDESQATLLAQKLDATNRARQQASEAMYEEASAMFDPTSVDDVIILAKEGWSPSLVGLVAGKLAQKYHRPVYVVGKNQGQYVGSGRGIPGFHVTHALREAHPFLERYGGHPEACGFTVIGDDRFCQVVDAIRIYASDHLTDDLMIPRLSVDAELNFGQITWDFFEQLERFKPYGQGNAAPCFCTREVKVLGLGSVGRDGAHLRLTGQSPDGKIMPLIAFGFGAWANRLNLGDYVDVVYDVGVNEWNGRKSLQLKVADLRISIHEAGT